MKLTFTLIALCFSVLLNAQKAGTLDSSFGVDGKVIGQDYGDCYAIALMKDDKIVMAGTASLISGFSVASYLPNGSPDSSFGTNGFVSTDFGYSAATAYGVAVQADGKIIAAGCGNLNGIDILLARYNADGSLDQTFGSAGKVIANFGGWEYVTSMALQSDGKIVVCGNVGYLLMLVRFNTDGSVDQSFGSHGQAILDLGSLDYGTCVAIQPDGKIIQGGYKHTPTKFLLVRYLNNGIVDTTFGQNGVVETDFNETGSEIVYALDVKANGIIDAAGTMNLPGTSGNENMAIAQYLENGMLDGTFGNDGKAIVKFGDNTSARAIAYQKDGKIILAGGIGGEAISGISLNAAIARLNANGTIDTTFADEGKQITDFGYYERYNGVALQSNGKIVTGGQFESFGSDFHYDFALARYNNDDKTKKQIIVQKIKHYIQTHNNAQATTLNNVSIYPNPAQNILHVQGLSANAKLTVVDFAGNVIVSRELSVVSNGYDLNVSSLHAGNYLLKVEVNGAVVTKQFVKE
jgi:uncharacterized delta-60 repeat protein